MSDYSITITTVGSKEAAMTIGKLLVENKLAACVQVFPIQSIYFWQDKICHDDEVTLFIKSKTSLFPQIKTFIMENHSYELPEIIQLPITDGLPEYLNWIGDCVKP